MTETPKQIFVDSHAHVDHLADGQAMQEVLNRAYAAGVQRIIAVGGHDAANGKVVSVAASHPDQVRAAVGYDRDQAPKEPDGETLLPYLARSEVVAVGEIGLDYYYERDTRTQQLALFEQMLDLARRVCKPVVVHSRDADDDTIRLLKAHAESMQGKLPHPGVLHCFTGGLPFAERLLELGMMIGFSGIITFKNASALRSVAAALPEDRLLLETDAPYLAPEPFRGKQNEPAYLVHVASALARIRGDTIERIAHSTTQNAVRLFEPARSCHE